MKYFSAVDLFSGSGSVTHSLKQNGVKVVSAVDCDPIACETYKKNHPEVMMFQDDIRNIDPDSLISSGTKLDLLVVCAPCQPFSAQNKFKENDLRRDLVLRSVRFVRALQPEIVFFENVPGLARSETFRKLRRNLRRAGYILSNPKIVDAADVGVPQRRKRFIVIASRKQSRIDVFNEFSPHHKKATVREAIETLPSLEAGEVDPEDPMHRARKHSGIVLQRLKHVPVDGGSRDSIPHELQLRCHRDAKKKGAYSDVYGRMEWDDVAPTLTTGCSDITRGRFGHPEQDRSITLREAASLQGFPRMYQFSGTYNEIQKQIGNAVPVGLFDAVYPVIADMLKL